jgi:hypothetical protein
MQQTAFKRNEWPAPDLKEAKRFLSILGGDDTWTFQTLDDSKRRQDTEISAHPARQPG